MKKTLSIAVFLLLAYSISNTVSAQEIIKGKFEHVVLFWLNNPDSSEDKAKIEAGMKELIANSKYIVSAHVGVPANTDRSVVDNSYNYNYTVTFESKETQDLYQNEVAHRVFIDKCEGLIDKVQIYDSINILEE